MRPRIRSRKSQRNRPRNQLAPLFSLERQPHTLPHSWYCDERWTAAAGQRALKDFMPKSNLIESSVQGVPAWITAPWALHAGIQSPSEMLQLKSHLDNSAPPLVVIDLPVGLECSWENWMIQQRHSRILNLSTSSSAIEQFPKNRKKQLRKFNEFGLQIQSVDDPERILKLHQLARNRKGIKSDSNQLKRLLEVLLSTPFQSAYAVVDRGGQDVANGVFLHHEHETVYAFGGQKFSELSAVATVYLISRGIEVAEELKHTRFDFGGSLDVGVDQFYKEFGAVKVDKLRLVRCNKWIKPFLKWSRPDLFVISGPK